MAPDPLTAERILAATEDVLRKYGPAKATVVDVARALGVSHGSVYRHFRTKAALREAVTKRWLDRTATQLQSIADAHDTPSEAALRDWLQALFTAKRHKAGDDPELFATYEVLLEENSQVVESHIQDLTAQLTQIIEKGTNRGEFTLTTPDASATALAVFNATAHFHDPQYAPTWTHPNIEAEFTTVLTLLLRGLHTT